LDDGVIDITDAAEKMESTFIKAAHKFLVAQALAIPGVGVIAGWFVKYLLSYFIKWSLKKITRWGVMKAFFINTVRRKSAQAIEYTDAIKFKENLPPGATYEQIKQAEEMELRAFDNLVLFIK
jgi:hypothetical protein